jgi:hypothetical protein
MALCAHQEFLQMTRLTFDVSQIDVCEKQWQSMKRDARMHTPFRKSANSVRNHRQSHFAYNNTAGSLNISIIWLSQ